jgi:hypothetical protein
LINGRNHLALKNALMQQMGYMTQPFLAGQFPTMNSGYVAFPPAAHGFIPSPLQSPYLTSPLAQINPAMMSFLAASPTSAEPQSVAAAMANTNAVTTDSTSNLGTLRQVQMQTTLLPAMCPSQFTQQQQQQQQQQAAAVAAQQQLQLAQPPGLTSKKGDQRIEYL